MKITLTIIAVLIGLLSIAAGAAKLALVPEEVAFLSQFGFANAVIMLFGAAQILGGLLVFVPKTRFQGAIVAGAAFAVSAALLVMAGNLAFATVSLLPIALATLVAYASKGNQAAAASGDGQSTGFE